MSRQPSPRTSFGSHAHCTTPRKPTIPPESGYPWVRSQIQNARRKPPPIFTATCFISRAPLLSRPPGDEPGGRWLKEDEGTIGRFDRKGAKKGRGTVGEPLRASATRTPAARCKHTGPRSGQNREPAPASCARPARFCKGRLPQKKGAGSFKPAGHGSRGTKTPSANGLRIFSPPASVPAPLVRQGGRPVHTRATRAPRRHARAAARRLITIHREPFQAR